MSLYADYVIETGLKEILETPDGFATYFVFGSECYVDDIYVVPEKRKCDIASRLADQIASIAIKRGCKYLTGSVNTKIKDPSTSMRVLLAYGFKFIRSEPNVIWFGKELCQQ